MALTITIPGAVEATIGATAPAILTVGVGVPGATGATGATGAQGPQGEPGEGVPAGGTAGQFLTKIDGTNYNTDWTTINLSAYVVKANNLSDLANAATARTNLGLAADSDVAFRTVSMITGGQDEGQTYTTASVGAANNAPSFAFSNAGYVDGGTSPVVSFSQSFFLNKTGFEFVNQPTFTNSNPSSPTSGNSIAYTDSGLTISAFDVLASYSKSLTIDEAGITFPDATVQTTAAVTPDLSGYAPLASPALTGNPTAPTAALADNDTSIATTAFVQQELASGTANARNLEVYARNQTGSTIPIGSIVYINGATGNRPTITLAQANNDANSAQTIGFTKTAIANNGFGFVIIRGELENLDTSALTEGAQLYLSPTTAGAWTTTKPYAPQHLVYVGIVIRSHPTLGTILVSVQNGYELDELHNVAAQTPSNLDLLSYESSTDLWKNKSFSALGLLTSATAASTYQTQAGMSSYATLSSPTFSGTPSLPTGTTAVTQSAGNNTTALATTAFVTAAVPAFATNAQTLTGTSAITAINPATAIVAQMNTNVIQPNLAQFVSALSGTGATNAIVGGGSNGFALVTPTTAVGYAMRYVNPLVRGVATTGNIQWTRPAGFCARLVNPNFNTFQTQAVARVSLGKSDVSIYAGPPTARGIAVSYGASATSVLSALVLEVHNGTSLTTVTSSFTPTMNISFDIAVYSDGAGNVTLYANGSQVATTSAGPSTNGGGTYEAKLMAEIQNTSTATATSYVRVDNMKFFVN